MKKKGQHSIMCVFRDLVEAALYILVLQYLPSHLYFSYGIENTVANTIHAIHAQRIPSSIQRLCCILIGCILYGKVFCMARYFVWQGINYTVLTGF